MSDINRLHKLNNLCKHLRSAKQDLQEKLANFKIIILRKTGSVNKMHYYENEYIKKSGEPQILSNSALYKNCIDFIKKINKALAVEKSSLETLEEEKIRLITEIELTERKIKSFEALIYKEQLQIDQELDNAETLQLNDLSIQSKIREPHE